MLLLSSQQVPKKSNKARRPSTMTAFEVLKPLRQWLNNLEIDEVNQARLICQLVPAQCPFARDISLAGLIRFRIPPLCKLNPLYEEVVALRFRALCYLAENYPSEVYRYC
ncbi:hypothetical protein FLX56_20765 [Synechococcus moorigangaii CMS01]|nr:hypothetical protein [Synechococcus moorigangaii CMS01]